MKKLLYLLPLFLLGFTGSVVYGQSTTGKPGVNVPNAIPGLTMEQTQQLIKASYDAFYPSITISYEDYWDEYCCNNIVVSDLGKGSYQVEYGGGIAILVLSDL